MAEAPPDKPRKPRRTWPQRLTIFAIVIAVLWLKEPFTKLRLLAIVLSAAAIPLFRFA